MGELADQPEEEVQGRVSRIVESATGRFGKVRPHDGGANIHLHWKLIERHGLTEGSQITFTTALGDKGPYVARILSVIGTTPTPGPTARCRFTSASDILAPDLTLEESVSRCLEVMRYHLKDEVEACCRAHNGDEADWIAATNAVRQAIKPRSLAPLDMENGKVVWDVQSILTTLSAFERTGQWQPFKRMFRQEDPLSSLRELNRMRNAIAHLADEQIDPRDAITAVDAAARLLLAAGKREAGQLLILAWEGLVKRHVADRSPRGEHSASATNQDLAIDPADRFTPATTKSGGGRAEGWYVVIPFVGHTPDAKADLAEFQFVRRRGVVFGKVDGGRTSRPAPMLLVQLQAYGLLPEAQRVHGAISKMGLRQRWWKTLGNRLTGANWLEEIQVRAVTPSKSNMTGFSTTLGLALGVLMAAARPPTRLVIATGELSDDVNSPTTRIIPIGGLDRKIAEICRRWTKTTERVMFLVPFQDLDGNSLAGNRAAFEEKLQRQITQLDENGIDLTPVSTLEEAAELVGAKELAPMAGDWAVLAAGAGALIAGAASWGFWQWHDAPINLEWKMVVRQEVSAGQAPFFRAKSIGMERLLPMIRLPNGVLAACAGDFVAIRATAPADLDVPVVMAGVFFTDRLTQGTKPQVQVQGDPVNPGESPYFAQETGKTAETNAVMIIAERWPASGPALQAELDAVFALDDPLRAKPKGTDISSVKNYLEDRFSARTLYGTFELIRGDDEQCR